MILSVQKLSRLIQWHIYHFFLFLGTNVFLNIRTNRSPSLKKARAWANVYVCISYLFYLRFRIYTIRISQGIAWTDFFFGISSSFFANNSRKPHMLNFFFYINVYIQSIFFLLTEISDVEKMTKKYAWGTQTSFVIIFAICNSAGHKRICSCLMSPSIFSASRVRESHFSLKIKRCDEFLFIFFLQNSKLRLHWKFLK